VRGCFVTGTDTGVGKTVVAAAIVAALRARGADVCARKPVITGLDEPPDPVWPPDDALLASLAGAEREQVSPVRYGPPASPHLAGELAGIPVDVDAVRRCAVEAAAGDAVAVVEGVGGLLVPIGEGYDVRALAHDTGLSLVIAARPGLGTINHTLLTLAAARAVRLPVAGIVLTPWPESPGVLERSNRETIARLGEVEVATLPPIERPEPALLAAAASELPLDRWLA
jgi:dethiobiotin synthetase